MTSAILLLQDVFSIPAPYLLGEILFNFTDVLKRISN